MEKEAVNKRCCIYARVSTEEQADFEIALQLATQLDFFFEKGDYDERRLLSETVFKRIWVKDGVITNQELNAPFALIARHAGGSGAVTNGGLPWS